MVSAEKGGSMVMEIREDQALSAIEEQEEFLLETIEDDEDFDEEDAELICAVEYLRACGYSTWRINAMKIEEVLERYRTSLMDDV